MDNENHMNPNLLSYKELIYFKEEIYRSLKDLEKKINEKTIELIQSFTEKIEANQKNIEKFKKETNIFLTKEEFKSEKREIIRESSNKNSNDEKLTSIEIQIEALRKDLTDSCFKYDKIYIDQLTLPGIIGDGCKFKGVKDYIKQNIEDLSNINYTNEKTLKDIRMGKAKMENRIKEFNIQIESYKQTINQNLNIKIAQFEERLDERFVPIEGDIKKLMNEINIPEKKKNYEKEIKDIIKNTKKEINDNIDKTKKVTLNTIKDLDLLKSDFKKMKKTIVDFSKILSKQYENGFKNDDFLRSNMISFERKKNIKRHATVTMRNRFMSSSLTKRRFSNNDFNISNNLNDIINEDNENLISKKYLKYESSINLSKSLIKDNNFNKMESIRTEFKNENYDNNLNNSNNNINNINSNNNINIIKDNNNIDEKMYDEKNIIKKKSLKNNIYSAEVKTTSIKKIENFSELENNDKKNANIKPILRLSSIKKKVIFENKDSSIKFNIDNKKITTISSINKEEEIQKNNIINNYNLKENLNENQNIKKLIQNQIIQNSISKSINAPNINNNQNFISNYSINDDNKTQNKIIINNNINNSNSFKPENKIIKKIENSSNHEIKNIKNLTSDNFEKKNDISEIKDSIESKFKNKFNKKDYIKNKQKNYSQVIPNFKKTYNSTTQSFRNNITTPIRIHKSIPTDPNLNYYIRKIEDEQIIDIPLIPYNKNSLEINKNKTNIEKRLIELEYFTKKKFDELVNEIKNFIPIHFNSYIKDYVIIDSSPIKNRIHSRLSSVDNESKNNVYS